MHLHRFSIVAAVAALWALAELHAMSQGRKAVREKIAPVVKQYSEVLTWEELN